MLVLINLKSRANNNPRVFYFDNLPGNYNGFIVPMIGIFIKSAEKQNKVLHNHEMIHWNQYQKLGLFQFGIEYLYHAINIGYDKNPFEIEARVDESEYCKHNYTKCIRSGTSRTTYNPNFRK